MKRQFISVGKLFAVLLCLVTTLNAAESSAKNNFNVRDYGAVGDGKNLDSPAIDRAINAAAEAGG